MSSKMLHDFVERWLADLSSLPASQLNLLPPLSDRSETIGDQEFTMRIKKVRQEDGATRVLLEGEERTLLGWNTTHAGFILDATGVIRMLSDEELDW